MSSENNEPKKVLWTVKIDRILKEVRSLTKVDKNQYRTDIKAVMCRGIPQNEVNTIKQGLAIENGMFYFSRLYVPAKFYQLYRAGVFQESFTFGEARYVARILIVMHLLDCAGHLMMKQWCSGVYKDYIGINEELMLNQKKKQMDDYIIQKTYFQTRKEGREANRATNVK